MRAGCFVVVLAVGLVGGAPGALGATIDLFAHDSNKNLYTVNPTTGDASLIGVTDKVFWDIAFDANGTLYGLGKTGYKTGLYTIDIDAFPAAIDFIGDLGGGVMATANALVIDDNGVLWAAGDDVLININVSSGAASLFGDLGGFTSAGDLFIDDNGDMFLTSDSGELLKIDRGTGAIVDVGAIPDVNVFGAAHGMGTSYGLTSDNRLMIFDTSTGAASFLADITPTGFALGQTFGAAARVSKTTPEPGSALALLAGMAWMVARRRR